MVGSGSWGYSRKTVGNTFSSETHVIECQVIGGWKGWKMITILSNDSAKRLGKHHQFDIFWLVFVFHCSGNPVIGEANVGDYLNGIIYKQIIICHLTRENYN